MEANSTRIIGDDKNPGVLGFSDQCKLAHCLGIVSDGALADLSTMSRVRNLFAHSRHAKTFADQQIKDLCANLNVAELANLLGEQEVANILGPMRYPPGDDPMKQFACSGLLLAAIIRNEGERKQKTPLEGPKVPL